MWRFFFHCIVVVGVMGGACSPPIYAQDEPPLPAGLDDETDPPQEEDEPALPQGLSEEKPGRDMPTEGDAGFLESLPFDLAGFAEGRIGYRTRRDRYEKDMTIGEARFQMDMEKNWTDAVLRLNADLVYDHVTDHHEIRLEKGEGWIDLREANVAFSPVDFADLKIGRQILTWGTGDLLFINDLFPKDWNSFFIGRDEEYLKAPSDALKASLFGEVLNMDVVYTPRFDADRYIDGRRISFWNATQGRLSGRDFPVRADRPDDWFDEDEVALRVYGNVDGYEIALYGHRGFWKSPAGLDAATGRAAFPELSALGASVRGNIARGVGNAEVGYYLSGDDAGGRDPLVRNSELRLLAGYEQEVATDFVAGLQYYLEWMMDHADYARSLPAGMREADEYRHVATVRLTRLFWNQNLELSLFAYFSPSDSDAFARPSILYKVDDHLSVEVGGNVFAGNEEETFFGQFERNSNVFTSLRYSF